MSIARIQVRTSEELKAKIDRRRKETGVPINVYINRLIEADLAREGRKSKPRRVAASA